MGRPVCSWEAVIAQCTGRLAAATRIFQCTNGSSICFCWDGRPKLTTRLCYLKSAVSLWHRVSNTDMSSGCRLTFQSDKVMWESDTFTRSQFDLAFLASAANRLNLQTQIQSKLKQLKLKPWYVLNGNTFQKYRDVVCHMGSHSVTCYGTRYKRHTHYLNRLTPASEGWYSIKLPQRDGRLSWPRCFDYARTGSRTQSTESKHNP